MKKSEEKNGPPRGYGTRFGPDWPGRRCGAKTRRGTACQKPALRDKERCQLHGGRSSGPKTEEGKARIANAHLIHGEFRRKTRESNRKFRFLIAEAVKSYRAH